ncbi:MAG: hypothetical protein H7282_08930 [Cytophagaceae bacterium]|nr:hypothetical protein [Cytophagaceae bacterium]
MTPKLLKSNFKNSVFNVCLILFCWLSITAGTVCLGDQSVSILSIVPYPSIGKTEGYIMISRDIKLSAQVTYYFSICDLDLKSLKTREEKKAPTETLESIAISKTAIATAFQAMNGTLTVNSYDMQWNPLGNLVYKRVNKWEGPAQLTVNGESGFILNRVTTEKIQLCNFIGLDQKLNKLWEVKSSLGFEDHVWPLTYSTKTDRYFYNSYTVNIKTKHAGVLISNSSDGKEVMRYDFDREGIRLVGSPALHGAGKGDVIMAVFDYVKKNKERGLLFVKMDVSTKKATEKFVPLSSTELTGLVANATHKQWLSESEKSVHPYELVKKGNNWVMVGQFYKGKPAELYAESLMFATQGGTLAVLEFDADLNIKKASTLENTTFSAPTEVVLNNKGTKFTSTICGAGLINEVLKIKYLNYKDDTHCDYIVVSYDKDGKESITKKNIDLGTSNTMVNVLEGKNGKYNVLRYTFDHFEVTSE